MRTSKIRRVQVQYDNGNGSRPYSFDSDLELKVGDRVVVPGNSWHRGDQMARVVSLESEYGGPCKWIKAVLDV